MAGTASEAEDLYDEYYDYTFFPCCVFRLQTVRGVAATNTRARSAPNQTDG
jgi:hypothetical protein